MKKQDKNEKLLKEFVKYCQENPEFRFWQALRNWSKYDAIIGVKNGTRQDTFYK